LLDVYKTNSMNLSIWVWFVYDAGLARNQNLPAY